MNFNQAISAGFTNYTVFSGRATRSEYWFWILFAAVGLLATRALDSAVFVQLSPSVVSPLHSPLNSLFILVSLSPSLAVQARRLHDLDLSGWWLLLVFTGIGVLLLLYWSSREGTPGDNSFGPNPAPNEPVKRIA
jgi:uncharacterized membrane protein YhaH (DUF805 family)